MCNSPNLPGIAFFSETDISQTLPVPITCTRMDKPIGSSWSSWAAFWKLLRLIG